MAKNSWFKHYNTASEGNTFSILWARRDYETIAAWWRLLELVSAWEKDNARGRITLSWALLRKEFGWNRQRSSKVLSKIVQTFKIELTTNSDETFEVSIPNWLKFQERRGGKREANSDQNPERGKRIEERGKSKEANSAKALPPLAEIWIKNRGPLPSFQKITERRLKAAAARWRENPSAEYWTEIVLRMARSSFCRGEKNNSEGSHRNWVADFDFFLRPETHVKVSEGKYDDRQNAARQIVTITREVQSA